MRFLDTDIMVDVFRGYQPAIDWLGSLEDEEIGIPGYVGMELYFGCHGKKETNRVKVFLEKYDIYWPTNQDSNRALSRFPENRLKHGTSAFDMLIGECAVGHGTILCSFNEKHLRGIVHLQLERPYPKNRISLSGSVKGKASHFFGRIFSRSSLLF